MRAYTHTVSTPDIPAARAQISHSPFEVIYRPRAVSRLKTAKNVFLENIKSVNQTTRSRRQYNINASQQQ